LSAELAQCWASGRIAYDLKAARLALADLPVAAFPAIAQAALAQSYGAGKRPGAFSKSIRIFWASLTGRV
jgi:hypothetical protein